MLNERTSFEQVAVQAAREAGEILVSMLKTAKVRSKGFRDLVTDADVAAQKAIHRQILDRFPDHGWMGEEDEVRESMQDREYCWVVDPLDGTTNFAHGFPNFAVSIALVERGSPIVGVVFDPMAKEMFTAGRCAGARLNDQPLVTSGCRSMEQALLAASFPPGVHRDSLEVEQFLRVLERSQSLRRLGSAALNLCYTACGRIDGYWTQSVKAWDVAAGSLICQEAGAHLTSHSGGAFDVWEADLVVASTADLHAELLECLLLD